MDKLAAILISVTLFATTVTPGAAASLRNHNRNDTGQQSDTGHAESPADVGAQPRCVGSCAPYGGMQGDRNPESPPYPHVQQR